MDIILVCLASSLLINNSSFFFFLWEAEQFSNKTRTYDHALAKKAPNFSVTPWVQEWPNTQDKPIGDYMRLGIELWRKKP